MTDELLKEGILSVNKRAQEHPTMPCIISPVRLLWLIERALKCSALEKELDDKRPSP